VIEKGSLNSDRVMPLEDGYQAVALPLPKNADRRISLGRAEDCDVVINDVSVSRVHAYLEHDGTAWSIVDGGSTAGTQLNDRLIPSGEPRKLAPLDRISVGYVSLVFTPASDFHGFVRSLFGL
jgi:pSer/pThr/pTyr-binding forkhead associated (FHA) protein